MRLSCVFGIVFCFAASGAVMMRDACPDPTSCDSTPTAVLDFVTPIAPDTSLVEAATDRLLCLPADIWTKEDCQAQCIVHCSCKAFAYAEPGSDKPTCQLFTERLGLTTLPSNWDDVVLEPLSGAYWYWEWAADERADVPSESPAESTSLTASLTAADSATPTGTSSVSEAPSASSTSSATLSPSKSEAPSTTATAEPSTTQTAEASTTQTAGPSSTTSAEPSATNTPAPSPVRESPAPVLVGSALGQPASPAASVSSTKSASTKAETERSCAAEGEKSPEGKPSRSSSRSSSRSKSASKSPSTSVSATKSASMSAAPTKSVSTSRAPSKTPSASKSPEKRPEKEWWWWWGKRSAQEPGVAQPSVERQHTVPRSNTAGTMLVPLLGCFLVATVLLAVTGATFLLRLSKVQEGPLNAASTSEHEYV